MKRQDWPDVVTFRKALFGALSHAEGASLIDLLRAVYPIHDNQEVNDDATDRRAPAAHGPTHDPHREPTEGASS